MNSKHWNEIYQNKADEEVSWFQEEPEKSLALIDSLKLKPEAKIIDVGGGNSRLVEYLLSRGFHHISILDISEVVIEKVKMRLQGRGKSLNHIVSDILKFEPIEKYDLWHDRATFHFLTTSDQVKSYLETAYRSISQGGYLIVSTFSKSGPNKCSGLPVTQYSDAELIGLFEKYFSNIQCFEDAHKTPSGTVQNFIYCGFKKK